MLEDIGLLAPFGDVHALADGVLRLLDNPDARGKLGARGRASVIARFSLDRLVGDVEALYRRLLT
jgi:mannosyltransferase